MPIIVVPRPLQQQLGEEASDALIELLQKSQVEQKEHLFEILEERFYRKVEESEKRLTERMDHGFFEIQKQFGEIQKQFGQIQKQFTRVEERFGDIQKQITRQTQWMIGLIGFLAITLKLLDLIFK